MLDFFIQKTRTIARIFGLSVIDQIIVSGASFAISIYLAYRLGIDAFGQYSLLLLIVLFFQEIQRVFITTPMLNFSAQDNDRYLPNLNMIQMILSICMAIVSGTIIYLSGYFFEKWMIHDFFLPGMIFTFARLQQEYYRRMFFVAQKPQTALITDALSCVLFFILLFTINHYSALSIPIILYIASLSSIFPLAFISIPFKSTLPDLKSLIKKHYHFSKWLAGSSLSSYLSGNILLFIGSAIIGSSAAGVLKISQYILGIMTILYQASENIIPYALSKLIHQKNTIQLRRYFLNYLALIMSITTIHGIIIFVFLKPILKLINGNEYTIEHYNLACLYIILSFLISFNLSLQYLLRAFNRTKTIFSATFFAAIINITFGKYIIEHYGLTGIMIGFFISQIILFFVYILSSKKLIFGSHENHSYHIG